MKLIGNLFSRYVISSAAVAAALLITRSVQALPSYDPFTNATSYVSGTSYTPNIGSVAGLLALQTNAFGEGWGAWSNATPSLTDSVYVSGFDFLDSSTNNQGVLTNNAGQALLPAGFPTVPNQGVFQEAPTSGSGYGACLTFNKVIYPPAGKVSAYGAATTNKIYASFLMNVTNWGNGGTGGTYYLGFVSTAQAGNQNIGGTASEAAAVRLYLQQKTASGGGYYVEIGNGAASTSAASSPLCNTNQTYFVVIAYEMSGTNVSNTVTNDHLRIWVNPATNTFGAAAAPPEYVNEVSTTDIQSNVAGFYFLGRSGTSGPPDGIFYGDLRIGTTWSFVTGGPEFISQPIGITNTNAGSTVNFSGSAVAGGASVSYQWQFNGVNLSDNGAYIVGSSTSNLTVFNVAQADVGSYTLLASTPVDPAGQGLSSAVATLTVDPAITAQPTISAATLPPFTNATVPLGTNVVFTLTATSPNGYTPLAFRWSHNGTPLTDNGTTITGSTTSNLTLSNVSGAADGAYTCAVTNTQGGGQISSAATLTVVDPAISVPPQSTTANYGGGAGFTVTALGTTPFTYQWLFNGVVLTNGKSISGSGATVANAQSQSLSLTNVTYLDGGSYSVIVSNGVGSSNISVPGVLTVNDPYITVQPVSRSVLAGSLVTLSATALGSPALSYQWHTSTGILHDGGDITGSTNATLTFSALSDADDNTYWVAVSGSQSGQTTVSGNAVVTAVHPVAIVSPPQPRTERAGDHTAFVVGATGTSLTYVWQSNGVTIAGMTGDSFYLTNIQASSAGTYSVTVSNAYSASQSASAMLSVVASPYLLLASTNLVVARVGDGVQTLNSTEGNTLYLDQFTTKGAYVNTVMIPDTDPSVAGTNSFIVEGAGNGLYESVLNLSTNGQYFDIIGYNANLPNSGLSFGNVASGAATRSIAAINGLAYFTVCLTNHGLDVGGLNAFPRSVVSTDGLTNFWAAGVPATGASITASAVKYLTPFSGTTFGSLNGGQDPRVVAIWNGNLYLTSGAGVEGLVDWSGIPTSGNGGLQISNSAQASPSPNDFAISPDGQTIYIADDNTLSNGGGIQRYDNGNETPSYTLSTGQNSAVGAKGLAVYFPPSVTSWGAGASGAVIYATTAETSANRLIAIVDTNENATVSLLAAAGPNQLLRGLRFGPVSLPATIVNAPQNLPELPDGQAAVFSATVSGTLPLFYQWQFNGTNLTDGPSPSGSGAIIAGSSTTTLAISNAMPADDGSYTIIVSNGIPSSNAATAVLNVTLVPQVEAQTPTNIEIFAGSSPTLFLIAEGPGIYQYQWTSNGNIIAGATGSTYKVPNIETAATYAGTVSTAYGTNHTSNVVVTVLAAPTNPYPAAVLASHPMDYWRLDEASGTVGYDYTGGNNGLYTNTALGGFGYTSFFNPNTDPSETAASFGNSSTNNSYLGWVPSLVNFATPAHASAAFSVEAWIYASVDAPSGAGMVSLGYGGREEFALDLGSTAANDLRFFVRDAAGALFSAGSVVAPDNGSWHHIVGVCDEANGRLDLYVDGQLAATNAVPAGGGILASTQSLAIGARQEGAGTPFDDQFTGSINEVALYNYALTSYQVQTHYVAAGIAPANLQVQPSSQDADVGQTVTFTVSATATPPLFYFWTDQNNALVSTNPALVLSNVQPGNFYYNVQVTNTYGQASASASLNVYAGPVALYSDLSPLLQDVPPGYPITFAVGMYGTPPIRYQWFLNTNTPISGATNSTYSFLASAGTNTYTLWATNQSGASSAASSTATVVAGAPPTVIAFGDGTAWTLNGGASFTGSPLVLELTDGNTGEDRSAFYNIPQYIEGFLASFTYTPSGGTSTRADGTTFALQNSSSGPGALGGTGGQLGYYGITPSVAFELDIYSGDAGGTGINWETNGFTAGSSGLPNGGTGPVNINSLDPIGVTLYYNYSAGQLDVKLVDLTSSASFLTNYAVGDLSALLGGNFAYVGFTGGTGGSDSIQEISNFAFSYSTTPLLSVGRGTGGTVLISWPATVSSSLALQQSSALTGTWSNVATSPTVVNGQYQVAVTPSGAAQFYRLILP
jgi:hypothetical protein